MIPSIYELTTFCQNQPADCLLYQEKEKAISLDSNQPDSAQETKQVSPSNKALIS